MTAPVAVVGAGWAGLAAAVALVRGGRSVIVFESGRAPGGRARTATALGVEVDNGQHLAVGAYRAVLELASIVGVDAGQVFRRSPLTLVMRDAGGERFALRAGASGRTALALGFLRARGLTWGDKLALLRGWRALAVAPAPDITVSEFLDRCGQPPRAVKYLWAPLCIATLNAIPGRASAALFARVIADALGAGGGASDLLLPAADLGRVLPQPAVGWLERNGADIRLGERVTGLKVEDGTFAVSTAHGDSPVSGVVLAVPPDACARILESVAGSGPVRDNCARFGTQPICTVYLRYPGGVALDPPLIGMADTMVQWLVDRTVCGHPGMLAAVISADGDHMELDNDALVARVSAEIHACYPAFPEPTEARVIREKRATFDAVPGIDELRPSPLTHVPGLVLAGDWTATGLPATLEGAVRSGFAAARELAA